MKEMKVIIDWSLVSFAIWSRMSNPKYEGATDIELVEFTTNCVKDMRYYRERFPDAEFIFAMDAPSRSYWRVPYLTEYYKKEVKAYLNEETNCWLLIYNRAYYHLKWFEPAGKWIQEKLKQDDANHLLYSGEYVAQKTIPPELNEYFPRYKKRVSNWPYETPQDEYKKKSNNLCRNLAATMGGKAIMVDGCEADDIAYTVSEMYGAATLVYITDDSDWKQIASTHVFTNFINPKDRKPFVELDMQKSKFDIWVKIIGGDKSDTIPGIALKGKTALIAKTRAEKLVGYYGLDNIGNYLKQNADLATLKRNLKLIYLKNCPQQYKDAIKLAILQYKKPYRALSWSDYEVKEWDLNAAATQGRIDGQEYPIPND